MRAVSTMDAGGGMKLLKARITRNWRRDITKGTGALGRTVQLATRTVADRPCHSIQQQASDYA